MLTGLLFGCGSTKPAGTDPQTLEPPAPEPIGDDYAGRRLKGQWRGPTSSPDQELSPVQSRLLEWFHLARYQNRGWFAGPVWDSGEPDASEGVAIYAKSSTEGPEAGKGATEAYPKGFRSLMGFALVLKDQSVLAKRGVKVGALLAANRDRLIYAEASYRRFVVQELLPTGDRFVLLTLDDTGSKRPIFKQYCLHGKVARGNLKRTVFPGALDIWQALGGDLKPDQRTVWEAALAALERGPNPKALDELGFDLDLAGIAGVGAEGLFGRRLGERISWTQSPLPARLPKEPAWGAHFEALYPSFTTTAMGRRSGEIELVSFLTARKPKAETKRSHGSIDGILVVPSEGISPAQALRPRGAKVTRIHGVSESFVLATTSEAGLYVLAFRQGRRAMSLDGPCRYGLLFLEPQAYPRKIFEERIATSLPLPDPASIRHWGERQSSRLLVTLLGASAWLPDQLGPYAAVLEPQFGARLERQRGLLRSSAVFAVFASRLEFKDRQAWAHDPKPTPFVDREGAALEGEWLRTWISAKARRYDSQPDLSEAATKALEAQAEAALERGAQRTLGLCASLVYVRGHISRTPRYQFLFDNVPVPDPKDPHFEDLARLAYRSSPLCEDWSTLKREMHERKEAPGAGPIRLATFEVGPWKTKRARIESRWREPSANLEDVRGRADSQLYADYRNAKREADEKAHHLTASKPPTRGVYDLHIRYQDRRGEWHSSVKQVSFNADPYGIDQHFWRTDRESAERAQAEAARLAERVEKSRWKSKTMFSPVMTSWLAIDLERSVELKCGEERLQTLQRVEGTFGTKSHRFDEAKSLSRDLRPENLRSAAVAARAPELPVELAKHKAALDKTLGPYKAAALAHFVRGASKDPRSKSSPAGWTAEQWEEERAWASCELQLEPTLRERAFHDAYRAAKR